MKGVDDRVNIDKDVNPRNERFFQRLENAVDAKSIIAKIFLNSAEASMIIFWVNSKT